MAETLNFTLSAQDKTQAAFNSVNQSMNGLNNSISKFKAGSLIAFTAAAAATTGLFKGLSAAVERASKLEEAVQKTGASAEFLSVLAYGAQLTGIEFENVEKGLTKLAKSMDAAASDVKSGIAFDFKRLGIEVKSTNGQLKSSEEVFIELADRISQMPDGLRKAAIAQAIFGKSGAELIPLLNEGGDGMMRLKEEAERLGVVFSAQAAKDLENFGDEMTKIRLSSEGFMNILAAGVIPAISTYLERLGMTSKETQDASSKFDFLRSVAEKLGFAFRAVTAILFAMHTAVIEVARTIGGVFSALATGLSSATSVENFFSIFTESMAETLKKGVSFTQLMETINEILYTRPLNVPGGNKNKDIGDNAKAVSGLIDKYKALIDPGYEVLKQMEEFTKLAQSGAFTAEEFAIGMDRLRQKLIDARAETDPMAMAIKGLQGLVQNFADNAASAMAEFTMTGKMDFKSMVNSMIKDLLTLFYKMTIFQPISNAFKGFLSGASTGGGGGLFESISSGVGDFFSGLFGRAAGGSVMGRTPYMVGEKGPELFIPGAHGTIIPNQNLGMGGGESIVINQTINVSTGVQATVRAEIQSLMPQIATATKSAVLDARRRGGAFSTAFGG